MADEPYMIPGPTIYGTPYDPNTYDPELFRQYLEAQYRNYEQENPNQPPPGDPGGGSDYQTEPAPPDVGELDEVVVEGERVPVSKLTDEELINSQWYGTDTYYEEMDRRKDRVYDLSDWWIKDWVPGRGAPVGPEQPGLIETFLMVPPVYAPTVIQLLTPVIAPILGFLAPLFPTPAGIPDEYDLLLNPIKPPNKPPRLPEVPDYFEEPFDWTTIIEQPFDPRIDLPPPNIRLIPFPVDLPFEVAPPAPVELPFLDPFPLEIPLPGPLEVPDYARIPERYADPEPRRWPDPFGTPRDYPNPWDVPFSDPFPFGDPVPDPFGDPTPEVRPAPRPVPETPARPGDRFGTPFLPGIPAPRARPGDPLTDLDPFPLEAFAPDPTLPDVDSCDCESGGKKKKKKKKKPREVCYRGTYIEKSRSLTKHRKEEIPCQ